MAGYTASNPRELKDIILRRMGAPIVNVELTEEQVFDCIDRSIELFTDYHPDGVNRSFTIVRLSAEEASTGIIKFDTPIYAITKVLQTGGMTAGFGGTTYTWFTDFVNSLAGGSGGSCNQTLMPGGADLTSYYLFSSYYNMLQDMLNPLDDYWYNSTDRTMMIVGEHYEGEIMVFESWINSSMLINESSVGVIGRGHASIGGGTSVDPLAEWNDPGEGLKRDNYIGNPELYSEQGVFNVRWVKDYATCLSKELNASILRRHQGLQLPGGVTIDGQTMLQEAMEERERLREELLQLTEPLPILYG